MFLSRPDTTAFYRKVGLRGILHALDSLVLTLPQSCCTQLQIRSDELPRNSTPNFSCFRYR